MPNLISIITILSTAGRARSNNEVPPKYLKQNIPSIMMLEAGNTAGLGRK